MPTVVSDAQRDSIANNPQPNVAANINPANRDHLFVHTHGGADYVIAQDGGA